jgi:hypothetical protein
MHPKLVVFLYGFVVLALGVLLKWEFSRARKRRRRDRGDVW